MLPLIIIKRNGTREPFTPEKIHKPLYWATRGLTDVSISSIEMGLAALLVGRTEITSDELHEFLIRATRNQISIEFPDADIAAGRLINYQVRKHAYGEYEPPNLIDIVKRNSKEMRYHADILGYYSDVEWEELNALIDHNRDDLFRCAGAEQMREKYLVKNRVTKKIYESFQIPYILVPAILFRNYSRDTRLAAIKEAYDTLSLHDLSLPTPIMAGLRTRKKQFASCVLLNAGDSLESITSVDTAATLYVANRAGLGINAGSNRGLGASIDSGLAFHTGLVPFIKKWTGSVKSCSQGAVRDGAVTFFYPMWHYEFPELVVLKDNSLTEDRTNLAADYAVQINGYLIQRLIDGKKISLFSPNEAETPGLYESFFDPDPKKFAELYEKYEADESIRRRTYSAAEIFNMWAVQRSSTGRIYAMFVDLVNAKTPFKVKIYQSNLCLEILLPTTPLQHIDNGMPDEISTCILAAVNMGHINKPDDFERPCRVAVRLLDEVIDYQNYPVKAAEESTKARRPIGVGIIGFAHFLAKLGLRYHESSCGTIDRFGEAYGYYMTKASIDLAKEKGPCPAWKETKYSDGWLPMDERSPTLEAIVPHKERFDWVQIRKDLVEFGIRHSTLMAGMPSETSSQLSGETNGFEPPRGPIVVKGNKDVNAPLIVPEYKELKDSYDYVWQQKTPKGYLQATAFFGKYMDQTISINTSYNPSNFPKESITTKQIIGDMILTYQLGHKTMYYQNTRKPGEDDFMIPEDEGCSDGACKI